MPYRRADPAPPPPSRGEDRPPPHGSWICGACGNVNYPDRTHCNKRSCGVPREGPRPAPQPRYTPLTAPPPPRPGLPPPRRGRKGAPEGSWVCSACDNVNYPSRTTCNARGCGRPREEVELPNGVINGGPEPEQQIEDFPEGSWVCGSCQNVNFPGRDKCNRRTCGKPRVDIGGGGPVHLEPAPYKPMPYAPPEPRAPPPGDYPEGSWVCGSCQNVNFPSRETCNRRDCGAKREDVDAGPPPMNAAPPPRERGAKPPPDGSWVCGACSNVNYPDRTSCNKRTCGKPREEVDAGPPP